MGVFEHFPYSNFHEMNLDWILELLKKWEDIADNIGEMIDDAVENGLSELNIEEIITNILINYEFAINVKNPPEGLTPAKGDGTTDDTAAISGCVNYAAGLPNGGIVFFPQGLYLTDTVTLPSNVTLMGLSKHNVKLVKKSSANSTFIGGNGSNNAIYGMTLDGNQAASAVNVNGFIGTPVDMEIRECNINNCGGRGVSWSGTNLTIDSVEFEGSGINCLLLNGNGNVSVKNVLFKSLSEAAGDGVIVVNSDNCDIEFSSVATCNKCLVMEGENNYVHCRIIGATIPVTDNGSGNSVINVVGDYKIGADNLQVNVGGDTEINAEKHINLNSPEINISNGDFNFNGNNFKSLNSNEFTIKGLSVNIETTEPLNYSISPVEFNRYFNSVKFRKDDSEYDVLVGDPNISYLVNIPNVKSFGAVGDGITNDTTAIQNCLDTYRAAFIPSGTYLVDKIVLKDYYKIIGEDSKLVIFKSNSNVCLESENFASLTGTSSEYGVPGITIQNLTIDCNNITDGIGINIYGYRYYISNIIIKNAKNIGFYSEWGTALGSTGDGDLMESFIKDIRIHHCSRALLFRGPHDSYFDNCLFYLSDYGITVQNREGINIADGTYFNKCHCYANSKTGIYTNSAVTFSECSSETSGYGNTDKTEAYGFIFDADDVRAFNCLSFSNGNFAFSINGANNIITGYTNNNAGVIRLFNDKGNSMVNLLSILSITEVLYSGAISNSSNIIINSNKQTATNNSNRIKQLGIIGVSVPQNTGSASASINELNMPVIIYQQGGEGVKIEQLGEIQDCGNASTLYLEPGAKIYFDTKVPTNWVWKPIM